VDAPSPFWPAVTLAIGTIAWLRITRLTLGMMFAPASVTLLILISVFGVRPLLSLQSRELEFYGYSIRGGFNSAAFLGFVAVLSFAIAYGLTPPRRRNGQFNDSSEGSGSEPGIALPALTAVALSGAWIAAMIAYGGGLSFLSHLFAGRSAAVSRHLEGMPIVIAALPSIGAVVLAVSVIRTLRTRPMAGREILFATFALLASAIPPLALGNRRFLLPTLLVFALVFFYRRWNQRVRPTVLLTGFAILLALISIPYIRSAGSRTGRTDFAGALAEYLSSRGPFGALEDYFVGYDTEMFAYISFISPKLGLTIPYGDGRGIFGDFLLNFVPSQFAHSPLWSDRILFMVFGKGCGSGACPVSSIVGVTYFDFGVLGVTLGLAFWGWLARVVERSVIHAEGLRLVAAVSFFVTFPALTRGNTINQLWITINILAVAIIAHVAIGLLTSPRSGRERATPGRRPKRGKELSLK
jgi:oligosaccharide repeat unit polymerase